MSSPEQASEPERVRAPNIRDVARVAGVSYQTVSRALNDSPSIRPETLARVQAAIEELGYRPNQAARALVTSRSRTIGVLAAQTVHYGPATSIQAIETAAREAGCQPAIQPTASRRYIFVPRHNSIHASRKHSDWLLNTEY